MLSEQQREARKKGVGGSLSPAILGVDKYSTQLKAFLKVRGELPETEETEQMEFGQYMEEGILRISEKRLKERLGSNVFAIRPKITHFSKTYGWMLADYDSLLRNYPSGLEIKNRDRFLRDQYGDPWTDFVMDSDLVQCTHYMIVSGYREWFVAVAFGGNRLEIFHLEYNERLANAIISKTREFWARVKENRPPDAVSLGDLDLMYSVDSGDVKLSDEVSEKLCQRYLLIKERIKALDSQLDRIAFEVKLALADKSVMVGDDGKKVASWKLPKQSMVLDLAKLREENPEVYERYLKPKANTRRFLVSKRGGK